VNCVPSGVVYLTFMLHVNKKIAIKCPQNKFTRNCKWEKREKNCLYLAASYAKKKRKEKERKFVELAVWFLTNKSTETWSNLQSKEDRREQKYWILRPVS
jgi:hypothetical protein